MVLLAVVVSLQLVLLAVQIRREGDVRLIRVVAVWVFGYVQRAGAWVVETAGGAWNSYVNLRSAREENEQLREENKQLKMRLDRLASEAAEARRLNGLLGFREAHPDVPMLAAQVVSGSASDAVRTVYINRGEADGIRKNMAVITPEGVVGKTLAVYSGTAQVLLISDKESGVGALLENSRTQGVVRGTGGPTLEMRYVINDQEVAAGERVLTSGQDRIFPRDIPVGTVVSTEPGSPFKVIRLKPAARLDRLEEVFVLLTQQPLERPVEETAGNTPAATPPAKLPPN